MPKTASKKTATPSKSRKKPTGYSVYNEDAKRRKKQNTLGELYPPLPDTKFDIIYADPPWDYNGKMQFDKTGKGIEEVDLSKRIFISSAAFKYPTLKLEELKKIPVPKICNDNCLLFMWTSSPHLVQAIELGQAWGFEYRTVAFVWDKMNHNPGQYTLSNCELCLVFKHGKIPRPRGARNIQQLIRVQRGEHSEKPVQVAHAIEEMFPTQRRIELFARRHTAGWAVWGLDLIIKNNEEQSSNREKNQQKMLFSEEELRSKAMAGVASKSEVNLRTAKGAEYDSQGKPLNRAKRVAPGKVKSAGEAL